MTLLGDVGEGPIGAGLPSPTREMKECAKLGRLS
jgi:hypothetical protein